MQKIVFVILCVLTTISSGQTCLSLIKPLNGATNVPVDIIIRWNDVEGTTGYIISIGTSPSNGDIDVKQVGTGHCNGKKYLIQITGIMQLHQIVKFIEDILV